MTIGKIKQIALEKYGKTLTDEQATQYAEKYGKLSDAELDNVSGGGCEIDPTCPSCSVSFVQDGKGSWVCPKCGNGRMNIL